MKKSISILLLSVMVLVASAMTWGILPPDDKKPEKKEKVEVKKKESKDKKEEGTALLEKYRKEMAMLKLQQDSIPDSLLHPRWPIQKTVATTYDDLKQGSADLQRPDNVKQDVEYNDSLNRYFVGSRFGTSWLSTPFMMDQTEYLKWSENNLFADYFRKKNAEIFQQKGKEKFDFTDMHFSLGPAEKIFGPGGIRVKTQGTAELKLGATIKKVDNPSLPITNRKTTTVDFDEKININVNGKIGDKMNMNLNYNTDATFDYDAQNMKLKYDGKEDEIIKLVEAGNVSFPSNSSLIQGSSSLFGVRTDMQFGKLKLQTVFSQKKSSSTSVSSKGGVQLTPLEMNVANYEENRHFFLDEGFAGQYDKWMAKLPSPMTGITISRIEVWATNKSGSTANTRDIVAFANLGDKGADATTPSNSSDDLYQSLKGASQVRKADEVIPYLEGNTFGGEQQIGGKTYEKVEKARLLTSSEYTLNSAMGFISLKTSLQNDQVLAVAFEYTSNGRTYQVGEFSTDDTDVSNALIVKALRNTECSPIMPNWKLMMKNVYYLASSVQKTKFKLDVKYQSDSIGVYTTYIPDNSVKGIPIIRLQGADRLDNNNRTNPNGVFDFVEGYTVTNGRVFFPQREPFGNGLKTALKKHGMSETLAEKFSFQELYDSTKTVAKQQTEKNKFLMTGQFKGSSANVISIGASNVPQGSVVVTAGGVTLTEGTDYSVDYSAGEVTILNQSIIDAGTAVNVSCESQSDYSMERKTMLGLNWEYDFTKNFNISGTFQHLREQALTSKVAMGSEPVNNTLIGFNISWKKESQWLTDLLNKVPLLHVKQPSSIQFTGEFAKLFSSIASGTQDNASYIDDFENSTTNINLLSPTAWMLSSAPKSYMEKHIPGDYIKNDLRSGYHRAKLAWYCIDKLFTNRSSSLTPSHIKADVEQLSNHYVREVYVKELYPNRDQSTYTGATSTLSIMNLAYYPKERGPYNFSTDLDAQGFLGNEATRPKNWGGMMRKLETTNFEEANVEYLEFWMLDPFIYTEKDGTSSKHSGKLMIDLGDISEDVLYDGKKFYESGMPVTDDESVSTTVWGKIPVQNTITYAFATSSGAREKQDVGLNGLNDEEEKSWFQQYLQEVNTKVSDRDAMKAISDDPAGDDYHYFRGKDFDDAQTSILNRYKRINNPQGNSPDSGSGDYNTSYKSGPDIEDINQDYTLNEYEKYYEYEVNIDHNSLENNSQGYIADVRKAQPVLRNGKISEEIKWYLVRIPLNHPTHREGSISDFSSIRFMRMYLTGFEDSVIIRLGSLNLVRGDWRVYDQTSQTIRDCTPATNAEFTASSINIEENNDKEPVNYILPPGISRVVDPSQPQLTENNEQSMRFDINKLCNNGAVAVYKNSNLDMRYYKKLQIFVHANATKSNTSNLKDGQMEFFIRLGKDYNNNYYEYDIPLVLTPPCSTYTSNSEADRLIVWPVDNMLDIALSKFTALKKQRNIARKEGKASLNTVFSLPDEDEKKNTLRIIGTPSIGEITTMMIGVKNISGQDNKDIEVWVNEMRLLEPESEGGWAAAANLNVQLSDLGNVQASGKYVSDGFGGLEQKVMERSTDKYATYSVTTNLDLGKFFPEKAKVTIPLYYSVTRERTTPKYNPLDTDMKLEDALESATDKHEKDSIESIAISKTVTKNFALSGVRFGIATKRHPMPYDPANFTFSYSHATRHAEGQTTVYDNEDNWRGAINYSWSPVYKSYEPFKKIKSKSKYYDILKKFALNYIPQNISAGTEMTRNFSELKERDLEDLGAANSLEPTISSQFLWNREFSLRWDITKNLHTSFQSSTRADIAEPYLYVNKDLYPDWYEAAKDSMIQSLRHMGTPMDYNQAFSASYKLPLNLIPIFDWVTADASYNATYHWVRGSEEDGQIKYGNTITNNRVTNINSSLNLEKLYNHVPFLKKVNEKFAKAPKKAEKKKDSTIKNKLGKNGKEPKDSINSRSSKQSLVQTQKKNIFKREITIKADTSMILTHGKKSKRLVVTAHDTKGKIIPVKFKKIDENKIKIFNNSDSTVKMEVSVMALPPLDDQKWYKVAMAATRFAMMIRNVGITYRTQYGMSLPGFMPMIGDVFGQRSNGGFAPGLDFAFGFVDDSYIDKAQSRGWLLNNDSISTPASTSMTKDLQVKMTLEPIRNLKIDLNMAHTETNNKSILYNTGSTTRSGSFSMTTISIGSAFEATGDANNGYHSATFEKFCGLLDSYRDRVESRYVGTKYPEGAGTYAGKPFDPKVGAVNKYSADVMVPAFLKAYTGYGGLSIFPSIIHMLPNWTVKYSGLGQLPWFQQRFKSVNINHGYKSIYAVGSYASYSSYMKVMGDGLGFIMNTQTDAPTPSSMFNVSTVSINESFSPLLGIDVTLKNNMTFKAEYRTTRVLTLSMSSVQVNETTSKDWIFGFGYKINDFRFFRSRARNNTQNRLSNNNNKSTTAKKNQKKTFAHDLNLRLDFSYRSQAAITRDIATVVSQATSGNTALKLSFMADYSISKMLTASFYYDRQSNTPLLSSGSYPTVTQDFGLSLKFSLTR